MDIAALTHAVTTTLVPLMPYLLRAGEKAAEETGEKIGGETWEWGKELWAKLWPRVEAKDGALEAARDVAATPDDADAQAALRLQLKKILTEDQGLANEINQSWEKVKSAGVRVTASGARSVAIGGNMNGIVNTGSGNAISGGVTMKGDGNVIGDSNAVHVIKPETTTAGVTPEDLASLISQMSQLLRTSNLSDDDRGIVETNLNTVATEIEREKPRLPLIESSLKSIDGLVQSTENIGSAAVKILPIIRNAVEYAQQLFP